MGSLARESRDFVERRGAVRESVRLTAKLVYGQSSVGCTVRDISATGASVFLPDGKDIPDEVTLSILSGTPAIHPAAVVWRLSPLIALRFKDA
jgi:hypothetical protein